jgi:hypothetical protein
MQRPEEKKHDLRDDMLPPLPVTDQELTEPLPATEGPNIGDLPLATPDSTKVPAGQTTKA